MTKRNWRSFWFELFTLLGYDYGFFIPYRYASLLSRSGHSYCFLAQWLKAHDQAMLTLLTEIEYYEQALYAFDHMVPPAPRWQQDWFTGLDGIIAYGLVRLTKPRRIIEIGCGHSTRFLCAAISDEGLSTEMIVIDPAPRLLMDGLPITLLRRTLQEIPQDVIVGHLNADDILFIDSSHLAMPGSDVDILFASVISTLPPGVRIHFHDIFLPDTYPSHWTWRGYNEQQSVIAALVGGGFELVFASHYVRNYLSDSIQDGIIHRIRVPTTALESSLWLRKITPALVEDV